MREIHAPLDTAGARLFGGRFNPPGVPALYLASDPELALRESTRSTDWAQFTPFAPRRVVCVRVRLAAVIDLSDPQTFEASGLNGDDLTASWADKSGPTASQLLGESALLQGVEGILYPSALDPIRANLMIFPDNLLGGSVLEIVDSEDR
jgi:RES domain-containing protein